MTRAYGLPNHAAQRFRRTKTGKPMRVQKTISLHRSNLQQPSKHYGKSRAPLKPRKPNTGAASGPIRPTFYSHDFLKTRAIT
jgi:hypothetical protein